MTLEIYGFSQSRAFRTLWLAEEIKAAKGLDFTHEGSTPQPGPELDALLAMNPMGQVPVINDDGFVLRESMAINLYLAKKHNVLAPQTPEQEALAMQWSFWVMTAVESHALNALKYNLGAMGFEKDPEKVAEEVAQLERPLRVLESHLGSNSYLVGDEFTVADLNVACVVLWLRMGQIDFAQYPAIASWFEKCTSREAATAARKH